MASGPLQPVQRRRLRPARSAPPLQAQAQPAGQTRGPHLKLPIASISAIFQPLIDVANSILTFFHDSIGVNWGIAIILLTVVTRIAILPLSLKQIRSMRALQAHQPEIKKIQEKYKDDRQRQQREMMEFYRENKINPLASCVPLLLQLPVFMSLFYLLRSSEFSNELAASGDPSFLGLTLDEKATGAALVILIGLYFVTMVGSTSIMAMSAEGNQRLMMYALPVFFTPFGRWGSSGSSSRSFLRHPRRPRPRHGRPNRRHYRRARRSGAANGDFRPRAAGKLGSLPSPQVTAPGGAKPIYCDLLSLSPAQ
ncbi:MAG: YidC/Oxa1 family membrane protein insertase [Actinobacteria bacterium]|nr:MAG: YidC/Oxa1 family membrane protein insertase [Actinomycetota bacterium]